MTGVSVAFKSCVCVCLRACRETLGKTIRQSSSLHSLRDLSQAELGGKNHCPFIWGAYSKKEIVCFSLSLCIDDICSVYWEHTVIRITQADDNSISNASVACF